jgi:hypothetical protein
MPAAAALRKLVQDVRCLLLVDEVALARDNARKAQIS